MGTAAAEPHVSTSAELGGQRITRSSRILEEDADDALKVVLQHEPVELDEVTNRRLLRKIDLWVMPILSLIYGFNFLDKSTLSYASVTGIQDDLRLEGRQYNWLGSLFYFGYLIFEYPAAHLLQRFPLAKFSGICVLGWGVVVMFTALCSDFAGAAALRFLLGMFEASVGPAWTLFTSQWFTKDEHAMRVSWWFGFNGMTSALGNFVGYGIAQNVDNLRYEISPWKMIYLVVGSCTFLLGIAFLIIIPDRPNEAWWLNHQDRVLVVERVRKNQQGIGNRTFKWYQLREALCDPIVWSFSFMAITITIPSGGYGVFYNLLIESFGYDDVQSLLYAAIGGPVFGNRLLQAFWFSLVGLAFTVLVVYLPLSAPRARLASFYLAALTTPQMLVTISLIASNVAGHTKKTTVAAIFFFSYCVGNICGPFIFAKSDAPRYLKAQTIIIIFTVLSTADLVFIMWWYRRQNRLHKKRRQAPGYRKVENQEFLDLTDKENPEFVYEL